MRHGTFSSAACAAGLTAMTGMAAADAHTAGLENLRDRVAALEKRQATVNDSALDGFHIQTIAPLGDLDQIGQRNGLGRLSFGLGETTSVTIYGFVRAEAFYDSDFALGDLTRAGRVGDPAFATEGEFDTSVRVSRLGFRSRSETDFGTLATQIEFDLFGSGGDESTSPNLRLRHANLTINDTWLAGQYWTNFMPLAHYPTTADFNGPVGIAFARVPQVRYTYKDGNGLELSASLEESNGGPSSDPVVTAAAFYERENYSLRFAALAGTFNDAASGNELDTFGITLSGQIEPWKGGTFTATYVTGDALGNLLIGGGAQAVGGVENESEGITLEYRHQLSQHWNVGIAYGRENYGLGTTIGTTANAFDALDTIHLNAFYSPQESLTIGLEYIYLESEGPNGFSADANRVGTSITLRF